MNKQAGEQYECPNCQHLLKIGEKANTALCRNCLRQWNLASHLCPSCGNYEWLELAACTVCGSALSRVCPTCHEVNWTGNDACRKCARSLSLIEFAQSAPSAATAERLAKQMANASHLKAIESRDSARRMKELETLEADRIAALNAYQQERRTRERRLLLVGLSALILLLVVLALYGLLAT